MIPPNFLPSNLPPTHLLRDGSGTIDVNELQAALKAFGIVGNDAQELLKSADSNGDGQIDYQEFCFMLRSKNQGAAGSTTRGTKRGQSRN